MRLQVLFFCLLSGILAWTCWKGTSWLNICRCKTLRSLLSSLQEHMVFSARFMRQEKTVCETEREIDFHDV